MGFFARLIRPFKILWLVYKIDYDRQKRYKKHQKTIGIINDYMNDLNEKGYLK